MTPVSHGKPCAGNPHARFEEGASVPESPRRNALLHSTTQKQAARKFVEYWTFQRGSEKGEDQQFRNSLLRDALGITDVEQHYEWGEEVYR